MRSLYALLIAAFIAVAAPAFAQDVPVTVAWDPNTEADLDGYILKIGTASGNYSRVIPLAKTVTQHTISLPRNTMHFAVVIAKNTSHLESPPSIELAFQVFAPGEGKAPSQPKAVQKLSQIRVSIEKSLDLKVWSQIVEVNEMTTDKVAFYRTVVTKFN